MTSPTYLLFSNNATSTLAGSITNTATSANLAPGTGALFPVVGSSEGFFLTFVDAATGLLTEIVFVTGRSGDTITMQRGQDNTTARAWNAGDIAAQLVTAGDMNAMLQQSAAIGRLTGPPQLITSTVGSVTFPSNTNAVLAILIGGGGSGGSTPATGAGQNAVSSGGNSGCYVEAYITSGFQGSSLTVGVGGVNFNGGNTIWTLTNSTVYTANGGLVGSGTPAVAAPYMVQTNQNVPAPPVAGEYFNTVGNYGTQGIILTAANGYGGTGGSIPRFGTGGKGNANASGYAGFGYGAGGGGQFVTASQAALTGGNGYGGCGLFYPLS